MRTAGRKKGTSNATHDEVERGLQALARYGVAERAAQHVKTPARTLRDWQERYADRLAEICEDHARARRAAVKRAAEKGAEELPRLLDGLIGLAATATREADRIRAAEAAARIAQTCDQIRRLDDGEPTAIEDHRGRTLEDALKDLQHVCDDFGIQLPAGRLQ